MQPDAHRIAQAYDAWSPTYDAVENRTRDLSATMLRQMGLPIALADVVEIGCGTGLNTIWLAEHARHVTALDYSEGMLAQARMRVTATHVTFQRCDLTVAWPLRDASADVMVCCLVLEHIARLAPIFAEAARVLRPGGVLYVCELHPARQMLGKQANFTDTNGRRVDVPAYRHDVSDYVNDALASGLGVSRLDEWRDEGAATSDPPRLLSLTLKKA
ncbi:MAG: methyltransferase domain-containing protein [Rhodospirillaceae bacterium]|nr:methyltransferase domain-containing protein [Rhodospirillaceae bacterium]